MSAAGTEARAAAAGTGARDERTDDGEDEVGPVGLRALCAACSRLYPDQPNPLQVTARVKYWLGGPDPLDYVSMYWNGGRPDLNVPPHWHYISMGVSDLHGDGRVHPPPDRVLLSAPGPDPPPPSGYGSEMTFRLAAPPPPAPPPVWPAALLQSLARYIFTTGVRLCVGDHISWHAPLDGADSRLRHLLVAEDRQLHTLHGPLGSVQFVQLVGATERELVAAQRGAAAAVLRAMSAEPACGGAWLVTDAARRGSCEGARAAAAAAARQPADLAGVSTHLHWTEWTPHRIEEEGECAESEIGGEEECEVESLSATVQEEIKSLLQRGLHKMATDSDKRGRDSVVQMSTDSATRTELRPPPPAAASQLSTDSLKQIFTGSGGGGTKCMSLSSSSLEMSEMARALDEAGGEAGGGGGEAAGGARVLAGVHVVLNAEGGGLLPLALRGRVLHSRHFTWKCASGARAVTLVPEGVSGALVSARTPYVATAHGWLQVLIAPWLARDMLARASCLERETDISDEGTQVAAPALPLVLEYQNLGLKVTVLSPDTPLY